ncbi:SRPBCC family protein [Sorangium sp. So ce1128]
MPLTSVTRDATKLTLTVVGDYPVPQKRLWEAFADPRQLERFWGPPSWPASDVPARSPNRGPPYWKSTVLRRKALGDAA